MSVLSTDELRRRLVCYGDDSADIIVSPVLDESQVKGSAIDVRLGRHFIAARTSRIVAIDARSDSVEAEIPQYQEKVFVDFGDYFVLQPGKSCLGALLEYVALPKDVYAEVMTRSSWGRLDITIATAVCVHPSYSGCLTLELENMGSVAVLLYPGSRIGQLILHKVTDGGEELGRGKYEAAMKPEFTKIYKERGEIDRFAEIGKQLRF